jgi:oligopeptide transport system ATP-binding protein
MNHLLNINNLKVSFKTHGGKIQAVRGVDFHLDEGEILAVVGESGCGKSVTAQSIMGLIPSPPGEIIDGNIYFNGQDLTKLSKRKMQKIRGSEIGMVFQDPMTSLNPTMKVGNQISEGLMKHRKLSRTDAREEAIKLLNLVGIPSPEERHNQYPHEFSGGMRQRIVIAIALACNPKLLIADEPTTALDVTIQAQILDLMKDLQREMNTAIMLITHDLGVVAEIAKRVVVMYAGIVVETGTVNEIFKNPKHPYTWGLLKSVPRLDTQEKERLVPIDGSPPDLFSPPKGCPFAARCEYAMDVCLEHMPERTDFSETHQARCWLNDPKAPKVEDLIAAGRE